MHDPASITFLDVEPIVLATINRFYFRFGGDPMEYQSTANDVFLKVYNDFDRTKGTFVSRLLWLLWKRLLRNRRNHWNRERIVPIRKYTENVYCEPPHASYLDSMSGAAAYVAKLAIAEAPLRLCQKISDMPLGQPPCKTTQQEIDRLIRKLYRNLRTKSGWSDSQIKKAFFEIKVSLTLRTT
jgi:hypothetical protein